MTERVLDARVASIGTDDPSDVVFTSGTTGNPKGVVMTHGQTLRAYLDWCDFADLRPGDRYLIANPFFHIFGYKAGCLACLMRGATNYPLAVFDPAVVLEIVERERITVLPGPPTIYHSLLEHPDRAKRDIASLRVGAGVGDSAHLEAGPRHADRCRDLLEVVVGKAPGNGSRLGEPVTREDALEGKLLAHASDQLDRDVGGARHREAQAGDVALRTIGVVEQRLVDGRWSGEHRDALALDELERDARVENGERHDRRAAHQ